MGLAFGKYKILHIEANPDAKKLDNDDVISYNDNCVLKQLKLKVPLPKLVVKRSSAGLTEGAESQRRFSTDAAIVRIMKARKKLLHVELVVEVFFIYLLEKDPC